MKTLDQARREASLAALAKARLRQAEEHRITVAARQQEKDVENGSKARPVTAHQERIANDGNYLRRCLNPDCLVWFVSRTPKANWCCEQCLSLNHGLSNKHTPQQCLVSHAMMVSKRNARVFDRPRISPYAKALVAKVDAGDSAIEDILHAASVQSEQRANDMLQGVHRRGNSFSYQEPVSSFAESWFLIGCDLAAAHPNRPCDHSGLFREDFRKSC